MSVERQLIYRLRDHDFALFSPNVKFFQLRRADHFLVTFFVPKMSNSINRS